MEQFFKSLMILDQIEEEIPEVYELEPSGFVPMLCTLIDNYCDVHTEEDAVHIAITVAQLIMIHHSEMAEDTMAS